MRIALIKKKPQKKQYHFKSYIMKKTYQSIIAKLVPIFADRWRAIRKHFINPDNKQTKKMTQNQPRYMNNTTRLYPRNRPQHKPTKNQVKIIKIPN